MSPKSVKANKGTKTVPVFPSTNVIREKNNIAVLMYQTRPEYPYNLVCIKFCSCKYTLVKFNIDFIINIKY